MFIKKVETWETSDGVKHSSHAMAEHHVMNEAMLDHIVEARSISRDDAQDILNLFSGMRPRLRCWLDGIDKLEKASTS